MLDGLIKILKKPIVYAMIISAGVAGCGSDPTTAPESRTPAEKAPAKTNLLPTEWAAEKLDTAGIAPESYVEIYDYIAENAPSGLKQSILC